MFATIGVLAALLSALCQAITHAFLAAGADKLVIRGIIAFTGLITVAPLTLLVPVPTGQLWLWLLASGILHAIYQLTLIKAYEGEDFSVAYPMARGIVPAATAILGIVILGERASVTAFIGIAFVSFGLVYLASDRRPAYAGMIAAMIAGLLTTAYTLLDAYSVRLSPNLWTFVVWLFVFDGVIMSTITAAMRGRSLPAAIRPELRHGLMAGFVSLIAYSSALIALRFIPVGSAAAIRETSIVFGAAIAVLFLKEHLNRRRKLGITLVALGGLVVALAR